MAASACQKASSPSLKRKRLHAPVGLPDSCRLTSPNPQRRSGVWRLATIFALAAITALPAAETSELARLADKSLMLDLARAGERLVAVGDRGHVLLSDDQGFTWRQVIVPTRAMLTSVSFADASHGWAAGHDGVILATSDAGLTWTRQDNGADLETVWLDVNFADRQNGMVVGAYGRCLLTTDGGKTWQPPPAPPGDAHLNHIAMAGGVYYFAGEAGTLLRADAGLRNWEPLSVPYDGSLYGTLPLDGDTLLVHGLRGHIYVSTDAGSSWSPRDTDTPVLIMTALKLRSGVLVLAGNGGNFFMSRDGARTFRTWKPTEYNGGVSAMLEADDGAIVVAGELGLVRLSLSQEASP